MRSKLALLALLVAACGGPSTPVGYVDEYGGIESQYEVLLESDDCDWLSETAAEMDAAYSANRSTVHLGYQTAAVNRMVEISCP